MGCMGCNKWDDNDDSLPLKKWENLLEELVNLDCKEVFLKGGDLTLSWDKTMSILDYARDMFEHMYITLHEQSISKSIIDDLGDKANIILQCEDVKGVPSVAQAHTYLITVKPEDWRSNSNTISSIAQKDIMVDFIIKDTNNLVDNMRMMPRNISLNVHRFTNNMKYHPCVGHTITITHSGDAIPCPMMRKYKLGNVKHKELYTIFENENEGIYRFWNLNLDKIEKCKLCEFRYACNDCRALEEGLTGRLEGKVLCGYNPENGDWLS